MRRTEGRERISYPSAAFVTPDGSRSWVFAPGDAAALREGALDAGARQVNEGRLEPLEAIERFGACATRELEELSGRPRPVLGAELWSLARDWELKPLPALTGTLWERA